jgi:hypothetical protein
MGLVCFIVCTLVWRRGVSSLVITVEHSAMRFPTAAVSQKFHITLISCRLRRIGDLRVSRREVHDHLISGE